MLEVITTFAPADGSVPRLITIQIGNVRETHAGTPNPWSAAVEILGFARSETTRLRGRDWAEAIEYAARFAAIRVGDLVNAAGGGTIEPPFAPRALPPGSGGAVCEMADDEG